MSDVAIARIFPEWDNTAVLSSYSFSKFAKIVDVGGGDGGLLVAILEANPTLQGVLFDLPYVAEKTTRRIAEAGLCRALPGRCR